MTPEQIREHYRREDEVKRQEEASGVFAIDTTRRRPGLRHRARRLNNGEWMQTLCGHHVINYRRTLLTAEHYADGSPYVIRCPHCFPADTGGAS